MNQIDRGQIAGAWLLTAEVFGKDLSKAALASMIDAVSDLNSQLVLSALRNWTRTSKIGRHPYPAEIRDLVSPSMDKKSVAIELARKIERAIGQFGWNWEQGYFGSAGVYWVGGGKTHSSFEDAVCAELGDLGWSIIQSRGGWTAIRNSANEMEEGIFQAQLRDFILAKMTNSAAGVELSELEMPSSANLRKLDQFKIKSLIDHTKPLDTEGETREHIAAQS